MSVTYGCDIAGCGAVYETAYGRLPHGWTCVPQYDERRRFVGMMYVCTDCRERGTA